MRTLRNAQQVLYTTLRDIAAKEGVEASLMMRETDITVDFRKNRSVLLCAVTYRQHPIWERTIPMSEEMMSQLTDDQFEKTISNAMRGTLSLAGQLAQVRLEKMFPESIKTVLVTYDPQRAEKVFQVIFKNGHMAEEFESELWGDVFKAKCTMLYDLPPL